MLDILGYHAIIQKLSGTDANNKSTWGYSSAGRALEWHSRGQRFDPAYLHQKDLKSKDFRSFLFLFDNLIVGMFRLLTQQAAEAYPKFVFCEIGTFPDSSILRISFLSSVNFKPPFS